MTRDRHASDRVLVAETDWLGSDPVFFNRRTGTVSRNVNDVIAADRLEFDPDGLFEFFEFGYSVFQQTPVRDVHFLRHSSRLWRRPDGSLEVEHLPDPLDDGRLDVRMPERDVIELLRERVRSWERSLSTHPIVPLSGGYDSRLLLWCLADPAAAETYTYGLSPDQSVSTEVTKAREVAARLGASWSRIELDDFHRYLDEWDELYGISTHAHGMYHLEFYRGVRTQSGEGRDLLTGIIGDAWAGGVELPDVRELGDVPRLGLTHGVQADSTRLRLRPSLELRAAYLERHRAILRDPRRSIVESMRHKMLLLSYLLRVPAALGFRPWSPFLDIDVAVAMLNLPPERRRNRRWQRELFEREGLEVQAPPRSDRRNTLDVGALRRRPLPPLDPQRMAGIVDPGYVERTTRRAASTPLRQAYEHLLAVPRLGGALRRFGLAPTTWEAYQAYMCLRPLDQLLRRADPDGPRLSSR